MKIRGKDRKLNVNKILIETDPYGGTNVSLIVNNQLIEYYIKGIYTDSVLKKINEYINVIGG